VKVQRIRLIVLLVWAAFLAWYFLYPAARLEAVLSPAGTDSEGNTLSWFKGNTHSHSKITLGDYSHGDSSPPEVVSWYRDHGYHFVSLTDHNRFETAADLVEDSSQGSGFLIIPGMEVTSDHRYPGVIQDEERKIHATGINLKASVEWDFDNPDKPRIIEQQVSRIKESGGLHILNHPNYQFQIELADVLAAKNVTHIELHNAHPRSNQNGHTGFRPAVEELWDQILSNGRLIYGIASDDAHDFSWYRGLFRRFGMATPGGAWVMVRSNSLDASNITNALERGDFYSSTGVYLKDISISETEYRVELDMERTRNEVAHSWVRSAAPIVYSDDSHFVIEFIGLNGQILSYAHNKESASIILTESQTYVRARITYLDKIYSPTGADRARAYYAWTQPVMTAAIPSDQ
jgi:hypothetical protein